MGYSKNSHSIRNQVLDSYWVSEIQTSTKRAVPVCIYKGGVFGWRDTEMQDLDALGVIDFGTVGLSDARVESRTELPPIMSN